MFSDKIRFISCNYKSTNILMLIDEIWVFDDRLQIEIFFKFYMWTVINLDNRYLNVFWSSSATKLQYTPLINKLH